MTTIFIVLVVLGFGSKLLATFPVNYAERCAWALWLAASVVWAVGRIS